MNDENAFKLNLLAKYEEYPLFVETGTATAVTAIGACDIFDHVFTIELDFDYYLEAVVKMCKHNNMTALYGDSGKVLEKLLYGLDQPCVILLDAHFVGDGVSGEFGHTPVLQELEAIFPSYKETHYPHVVLIDDYRLFGFDPAYPNVQAIKDLCERIGYKFQVFGDVMVLSP